MHLSIEGGWAGAIASRASSHRGMRISRECASALGFGVSIRAGQSRCWEISFEISTMDVLPVNSNFTLPRDEK